LFGALFGSIISKEGIFTFLKMIKKFLLLFLFIAVFIQSALCDEVFKITSVNFDTSNSIILLTSPDNTVEPILKNIKLVKLHEPERAYFDIDSAVLTVPGQNWFFNTGLLKQVKVGQFSTNPNKVRVVLYFDEGASAQKVSFLKVNNNIVIKLKDGICKEDYFQNIYRDERTSSSDFYEYLSISDEDANTVKVAVDTPKQDEVLAQIQKAFNASIAPQVSLTPVKSVVSEGVKKELKLKSKYYLDAIYPKQDGILLSGFGAIGIEKPLYLTEPSRVVFDIPNAVANPKIRNKEIKLNDKETLKIGQFLANKVRIVITTEEKEKYFPVFSSDGQSILISDTKNVDLTSLFSKTTDIVTYYSKQVNPTTSEYIFAFNTAVVTGIQRDDSKIEITFYNALRYNDVDFKNSLKSGVFANMKMELLPKVGLKLTLPLKKETAINCDLGADAKAFKITLKGEKTTYILPKRQISISGEHKVMIDPGHGGADYGAIRAGINEKDITLDISKRVESILREKGVTVLMTRVKDDTVSLKDRTFICCENNPDIFVSIHVNSSTKPEITGIETHYYQPQSVGLAQTIHSSMMSLIKSPDRGLFKSRFYVINHTEVPAILVEIGFLSNDAERAQLVSEQRKQATAQAIAEGILKYLNQGKK